MPVRLKFHFLISVLISIVCLLSFSTLFANRLLDFAFRTHKNGDLYKAELFYLEAMAQGKNDALISYNLGNLYYETKRFGEAIFYYEKVIDSAPQFKSSYHNLAKLYLQNDHFSRSLEVLHRYEDIDPNDYETLILLGDSYRGLKLHNKSAQYYNLAKKSAPRRQESYLEMASLYLSLEDRKRSLGVLKESDYYLPESDRLKEMEGDLLLEGQPFPAYLAYQSKLESQGEDLSSSDYYRINLKKSFALWESGLEQQAINTLQKVVIDNPKKSIGLNQLKIFFNNRPEQFFEFGKKFARYNLLEANHIFHELIIKTYQDQQYDLTRSILKYLKSKKQYQSVTTPQVRYIDESLQAN